MAFPNRDTFTFNHSDQVNEYGKSVDNYTTVQANFDSRAQENLDDINDIVDTLEATADGASGADAIGATQLPLHGSAIETIQAQLEALDLAITESGGGTVDGPESATDESIVVFDGATGSIIKEATDASGTPITETALQTVVSLMTLISYRSIGGSL